MARAEYKLPNVFVGCPYSKEFNYAAFKTALDRIPFRWYYADTGEAWSAIERQSGASQSEPGCWLERLSRSRPQTLRGVGGHPAKAGRRP
jgi:hypothetical protein